MLGRLTNYTPAVFYEVALLATIFALDYLLQILAVLDVVVMVTTVRAIHW